MCLRRVSGRERSNNVCEGWNDAGFSHMVGQHQQASLLVQIGGVRAA